MSDRELLEMAAKAAGVAHECIDDHGALLPFDNDGRFIGFWNPLTDDGDALRLAVHLKLHITNGDGYAWASHISVDCTQPFASDKYAATRIAIVRVAAEIGRSMP